LFTPFRASRANAEAVSRVRVADWFAGSAALAAGGCGGVLTRRRKIATRGTGADEKLLTRDRRTEGVSFSDLRAHTLLL
jgi:hypothetical protein